jgi:CHAD domain-containing protein
VPEQGADPANVEVEWQLDALDLRPVERWLATFPRVASEGSDGLSVTVTVVEQPVKRTVDVYLDTQDWRIGRSGFVLRVRHQADQGEVTMKDTTPAVAGLRRRIEVSQPLPSAGLHALDPEGPVGRRLRALAGDAPLTHLLEVRTRRRPYELRSAGERLGEVDLDDTIIVVGDDQYPVRMRRVEIEVRSPWVELLTPLVDRMRHECGLQPAILSKFEAGLLAAGMHVPEIPDLGPTTLAPNPTIGAVAYAVLRRNLASMLAHEAGTRLGEDIEQLHDMRVATRRLRAALALFAGVLPGHALRLRVELSWLANELGVVRDLDVQLQRLEGWRDELPAQDSGALTDLARLLGHERHAAREAMLRCLDSPRYDQLVSEFTQILRPGPGQGSGRQFRAAQAPAAGVVPGLIMARHRSAVTAARRARRSGNPADYHRLRIRCKRLRYALEFVSEIYDDHTRGVVKRVVKLQDCLGVMQDAQVAASRLHALATAGTSGLSSATLFAMGGVAERYRREADRLALTLPASLDTLKGPRWRRFKALMERRRSEAGSPDSWSPGPPTPTHPAVGRVGDADTRPDPPAPWPRASPSPAEAVDDDSDWDDVYAPVLRSVPPVRNGPDDTTGPDRPQASAPPPTDESAGQRRGKEPVFLPASTPHARPNPGHSGSRADPPDASRVESPDADQNRSMRDRP